MDPYLEELLIAISNSTCEILEAVSKFDIMQVNTNNIAMAIDSVRAFIEPAIPLIRYVAVNLIELLR